MKYYIGKTSVFAAPFWVFNPLKSYINLNGYDDWLLKYFFLAIKLVSLSRSYSKASTTISVLKLLILWLKLNESMKITGVAIITVGVEKGLSWN
jgi:hypothetical protein